MTETRAGTKLTGEDLLEIQAETRKSYELIEGELVEMSPTGMPHGEVCGNIYLALKLFVRERQLGKVLVGEVGFCTRNDPYTVRAADVAYVSAAKIPEVGMPEGFSRIVPDLIVEVVSPNDRGVAIVEKVGEWLAFGVAMVWVVYPNTRSVHVYTDPRSSRILSADDTLEGGTVLAGFSTPVRAFFEG